MGASYSFVFCLLGSGYAAVQPPVESILSSRETPEKLKILGGVTLAGLIMFIIFYQQCMWSMDVCGLLHYATAVLWGLAIMAGSCLGFGITSLIMHFASGGSGGAPNYNTLQTTAPSVTMI